MEKAHLPSSEALPNKPSSGESEATRASFVESYNTFLKPADRLQPVRNNFNRLGHFISRLTRSPESGREALPAPADAQDMEFSTDHAYQPDRRAAQEHLRQAVAAAEKNLPAEAKNERRHEIKGEADAAADELASSVGQILDRLHHKTALEHAALGRKLRDRPLLAKAGLSAAPQLYRRAIITGFGCAVLIILAAVMAYK